MRAGRKTRLRVLRGYTGTPEGRGFSALITMVRVVGRMTTALAAVVKPHGLTVAQFEVLISLHGAEGVSQQDLAERLLVTKGNVCVTVQRMEAMGLVLRRTDPTDQRYQRLFLAPAGRRRLAGLAPSHNALINRLAAVMSPSEQSTFHEYLSRLDTALDEA